ncbi:ABC transporter permease [Petralouisia muris]|uniref:ABC transporter permease n=1 Tax=Petralouisia muris TaxID=3032872 RepID=A0AC61RNR5_9FIRM|nr:ABC transporter permease [Petralouisia muris]TGY89430.1 ABC transporter permease [Petralouisia muris]
MPVKFKVFRSILFSKKGTLYVYIMVLAFFMTFINFKFIASFNSMQQSDIPDIVVKGKMDEDGELKYKYYNDMPDVSSQLRNQLNEDVKIYPVTARSMMTDRDPLTNATIEYTVYGVSNEFLDDVINKNIQNGNKIETGSHEILMGSYAKNFYELEIGDVVNHPVTLKKDWMEDDIGLYKLSGVLSNQLSYFKGGIFLSREKFEKDYGKINDNMIFIYLDDKESFEETLSLLQSLRMSNPSIGTISMNYYEKHGIMQNTILSCSFWGIMSLIVILLLVSYLMKGTSRKIGILKALGISNKIMVSVFNGGMMIVLVISMILALITTEILTLAYNHYLSGFYGFEVEEFMLNLYCVWVDLVFIIICFCALSIRIYKLTRKTSPKAAMQKIN